MALLYGKYVFKFIGNFETLFQSGCRILHSYQQYVSSSCIWCLPPVAKVGSVGCVGFLMEGTGACVLVGC